MKIKHVLMLSAVTVWMLSSQRALGESWVCGGFDENDGAGIVDESITLVTPANTTATTTVSIGTGGSSANRSYSWWFKNKSNSSSNCASSGSGSATSTTGLLKQYTWLRTSYAWGGTRLECTTTGKWGLAVVTGIDYCGTDLHDCD